MSTNKNVWKQLKKNAVSIAVLMCLIAWAAYTIYSDAHDMQVATTFYEYSKAQCCLIESVGKYITWCIYLAIAYLTYIHKQYTRYILWLYYLVVVIYLIYFIIASSTADNVLTHIEYENIEHMPSLIRSLYGAPVYFMLFSLLFMPKLIKDTIKLKKEQDLTV